MAGDASVPPNGAMSRERAVELIRSAALRSAAQAASKPAVDPGLAETLVPLVRDAVRATRAVLGRGPTGRIRLSLATPRGWAAATVDDYLPIIEAVVAAGDDGTPDPPESIELDRRLRDRGLGGVLGGFGRVWGVTLALIAGDAVAAYELPLPRAAADRLLVVPSGLSAFSERTSLDTRAVQRWGLLHDVVHCTLLGDAAVSGRLVEVAAGALGGDLTQCLEVLRSAGGDDAVREHLEHLAAREDVRRLSTVQAVLLAVVETVAERSGAADVSVCTSVADRLCAPGGAAVVRGILGFRPTPSLLDAARGFVAAIVAAAGPPALALLTGSVPALPAPEDLADPDGWLGRSGAA